MKLTPTDLEQFIQSYWDKLHVEMLVNGNYNQKQAKLFAEQVFYRVKPTLQANAQMKSKVVRLPSQYKRFRALIPHDNNHVALWYVQNEDPDHITMAKTLLLAKLMEHDFYQKLRVEKQLGYALNAEPFILNNTSGLIFWIQSAKTPSNQLIHAMSEFNQQLNAQMKQMNPDQFQQIKQGLMTKLRQPPSNPNEQSMRWWMTIESGEYDFFRNQRLAESLSEITLSQMVGFAENCLNPQTTLGQLLIVTPSNQPIEPQNVIMSNQSFKLKASYFDA